MEKIRKILGYSQTLSIIGIIILLTSVMDLVGVKFLRIPIKMELGVYILGLYHILRPLPYIFEE